MAEKTTLRIAVLMGGNSAERDVSLATGKAVVEGLKKAGHEVVGIDTALGKVQLPPAEKDEVPLIKEEPPQTRELSRTTGETTVQAISSPDMRNIDLVFIALHGGSGENGTIQALLDLMEIPYTGSGVLGSAVSMDKLAAKRIVSAAGIPTPEYFGRDSSSINDEKEIISEVSSRLGFPVVVKPNDQGSSVGLSIVEKKEELLEKVGIAATYSNKILFEKYIKGRELTVAILGDEALPVAEVCPKEGFYDYRHKYIPGLAEKIVPAPVSDETTKEVQRLGLAVFQALSCSGFARVDFRMSEEGQFFFLELNSLPGMTATSLVPKAAAAAGIDFPELLDRISRIALADYEKKRQS